MQDKKTITGLDLLKAMENAQTPLNPFLKKKKRKKKDDSKNGDMFLNCRSCKTIIKNDYRSARDTRYCVDCF